MHAYLLCVDTCAQCLHTCVHMYSQRKTHRQVQLTHTHTHTHSCVCVMSLQSCSILCDPMGCGLPGSSVHGILQARIQEWAAMPSSRKHTYACVQTDTLLLLRRLFLGGRKACGLGPNDQILYRIKSKWDIILQFRWIHHWYIIFIMLPSQFHRLWSPLTYMTTCDIPVRQDCQIHPQISWLRQRESSSVAWVTSACG